MDDDEADRLAVVKLIQRAIAGNREFTEGGSGYLDETALTQCLVHNRDLVRDNPQALLEQAKLRLENFQQTITGPDTTKDRIQWRVRFILCCIDILLRVRFGGHDDRQRRMADSALMVNSIVDQLVPEFGAYALAIYAVLEGKYTSRPTNLSPTNSK